MSGYSAQTALNLWQRSTLEAAVVRVTPGAMEARFILTPFACESSAITLAKAREALTASGVVHGIDTEALERLVQGAAEKGNETSRSVVVARGTPASRGQDASITWHELLQAPSGRPQEKADGSVDYFALNLVHNVAAGTLLATRTPATRGSPGTNVLGEAIPGIDGRETALRAGKGCRVTPDGLSLVAEIDGHVHFGFDGRLMVSPLFVVRGDVDTGIGNIDFVGSVVINGSVGTGFSVRAGQSVEIHGGIDGGSVEAGGDIQVRYGIQGGSRGRVKAGGKIRCRFVENGEIRCQGDLVVDDGILHSRVQCGGRVLVTGRRGSIIGGRIRAKEEVSSRVLGSSLLTLTEIEVGVSPGARDEFEQVRRSLQEMEEGVRKARQVVLLLREMETKPDREFTQQHRSMLLKALRSQYHCLGRLSQLRSRKSELERELAATHMGRVKAHEIAFPGVRVVIGQESYHVIDAIQHVCFFLSEQRAVHIGSA